MSLDLATLQVGDIIRNDETPRVMRRVLWTDGVIAVLDNPTADSPLQASARYTIPVDSAPYWSVVVPPPPCPITEPVTLYHRRSGDGCLYWTPSADTSWLGTPTGASLTLHPHVEGDVDDDGPYMKARWT